MKRRSSSFSVVLAQYKHHTDDHYLHSTVYKNKTSIGLYVAKTVVSMRSPSDPPEN